MSENTDKTIELTIEKLVTGGRGLARDDGRAVFVPDTAPGDRVQARITKESKGFVEAELVSIEQPGPGRREAPCRHHDRCGGCGLQHLDDGAQAAARREILLDCFRRLGSLDISDKLEPEPAGPAFAYRHRLRLSAHPTGPYGLHQRGGRDVVPLETCPVMAEPFDRTILPWLRMLPPVDQIVVQLDGRGGWLLSLYGPPQRLRVLRKQMEETGDGPPAPGLQGLFLNNRPVWGRGYLVMHLKDRKYRVSHQSFFQANLAATEAALDTVNGWLDDVHPSGSDLVDLFAGVGLFALNLLDRFERVTCVEGDETAAIDAKENARRISGGQERVAVYQGDVSKFLVDPEARSSIAWGEACVVVDPPRAGLGKPVLSSLAELRPRTLVYMSCDPATLARDVKALGEAGYSVDRVRPISMFPQTAHVETLVLLTRSGA